MRSEEEIRKRLSKLQIFDDTRSISGIIPRIAELEWVLIDKATELREELKKVEERRNELISKIEEIEEVKS